MRDIDLPRLMKSLYESGDYFVSVEPEGGDVDYEEAYHFVTVDPDGKKRNLLEEREQWLAGVKEIHSYIRNLNPGKMLDIGCGLGWLLSAVDPKWVRHGIEISKFASKHASQFGEVHNGILDTFQGKDGTYDLVVMNHVIEHLTDPVAALRRIHGLLKPGGVFILGTPDFDSGAARRYGKNFRLLHDPTHISLFSSDSMHRCLRDNKFKIKYVEYPFFDTPWFSRESLMRLLDDKGISPPFYGSAMTFFCTN